MKSFSTFIIETSSDGPKKPLGSKDSSSSKNNKSGNRKNTNVGGKKSSRRTVNTRKTNSSNTSTTGKNVVDVVDKSGKNVKVDLDSQKFNNSQQMRGIESDPQSKKIQKDIERQTNTKTRDYTQKGGVTKGNDSASMNRRLSAQLTKQQQRDRAYGTAGTSGDSNMGAGAGGASGNTKAAKPKPVIPSSDVEMLKKTNIKSGGKVTVNFAEPPKSGQDKLLDKIFSPKPKRGEKELNKAVLERPSNKPPVNPRTGSRIPNPKKGELGKVYASATKKDPNRAGSVRTNNKINQELTAKRQARIDPNTGKATKKGVENFAINQQTKGLSTKGDAGKQAMANAKKIASNTTSKAYKDIETKINTSDYAGKRAKLASTKELNKIAKDLKTSKTINAKVDIGKTSKAPTAFSRPLSPSKTSLNTATRKGKTYKGFADKASKSKFKLSKLSPKTFASKAVAPAFAIWNFRDNYKNTKGSGLRKFTKAALKTGAYYAGASGGAAVGTAGGSFTGPGAFVTGTVGAIAGGETAANLTDKAFNKIWKPPTTKGKGKGGGVVGGGSGNKGNFKWKSGISIGPGKK